MGGLQARGLSTLPAWVGAAAVSPVLQQQHLEFSCGSVPSLGAYLMALHLLE